MEMLNNEDPLSPSPWAGLRTRVISGAVLAAVALLVFLLGGWWFTLGIIVTGLLALREWDALTPPKRGWSYIGLAYIAVPCASLIWLRGNPGGLALVLYVTLAVWAADIGAYFSGRYIGGPKLAPAISPSKTWAGLGGGMSAAAVVGGGCAYFTPYPHTFLGAVGVAMLLAVVAQLGDLFESWIKRRAGVKDSGSLIPGHGGLLDRIDGIMFTAPLFALLVWLGS
jgi:phosphatidate cytidylyltransferase